MRRPLSLILMAAAALSLAGCARKASPTAPPGAFYPHTYPEVTFPASAPAPAGNGASVDDTNPAGPAERRPENRSLFDSLKHPEAGGAQ